MNLEMNRYIILAVAVLVVLLTVLLIVKAIGKKTDRKPRTLQKLSGEKQRAEASGQPSGIQKEKAADDSRFAVEQEITYIHSRKHIDKADKV